MVAPGQQSEMHRAETKTVLSAIATGVVGVNESVDKEFFQNNAVQALQLQMRSERATVETKLNTGMGKTIARYPLQNGIRDVIAYYHAGSITEPRFSCYKRQES